MRLRFPLWLKRLVKIFALVLLLLVLVLVSGLVFIGVRHEQTLILPAPNGSYAIGRQEYVWTDKARVDTLAPRAGTKREFVVWSWYPAVSMPGARSAPYLPQKWGQISDQEQTMLGLSLKQRSTSIQTHSIEGSPLAKSKTSYPVLIFEPGMGNTPTQYTTLLEDLASHGYIIFAITPIYSANIVVFPDGHVARSTPAGNPEYDSAPLLNIWSQDVLFAMDQLEKLNTDPGTMFTKRLDLTRLGVFGHSFGGATAVQVCHMDSRCKAGINMDGYLTGDTTQMSLTRPFLFLQSDIGSCSDSGCQSFQRDIHTVQRTIAQGASYNVCIKGAEHFNFSDYALDNAPWILRSLGALGPIDGARGLQITRAYVLAFFDMYLNHTPSPLLQGKISAYPEVQFLAP
ncbi:alpha/beta hydrolase family protein [Ktedonospora formicarum]|uniref:Alpha/beta hydrolase n=1 Tax=Ktedonospora formicarum TaxID=2778364 RepID=A0A8J3I411_9CHLR|nr:hypothetical protein [Ktedonospora formicarum]GHO47146.1 alpha/beta hydrolase [Ktedonospora formicarum]